MKMENQKQCLNPNLRPHDASPRTEPLFGLPQLFVSVEAYKRICLYTSLLPLGGDWLGSIVPLENGDFLLNRVFLIEQTVDHQITQLSEDGKVKLRQELLEIEDGEEIVRRLHFCGRSHGSERAESTLPDDMTMSNIGEQGYDFFVRGIFGKQGRASFDIYYYRFGIVIRDVEWAVVDNNGSILLDKSFAYFRRYLAAVPGLGMCPLGGLHVPSDKRIPQELLFSEALVADVEAEIKMKVTY